MSVRAAPLGRPCLAPFVGAARLPTDVDPPKAWTDFSFDVSASSGVLAPSVLGVVT